MALLLASASFFTYEFFAERQEITDNFVTLADVIGENSTAALVFDDPETAKETLMSLQAVDHLMTAAIYGQDGSPFATYFHANATHILPPTPSETDHQFEDRHLVLFRPIILNEEQIGVVYLQADLRVLYARQYQYAGITLIVMLVSSVVAFLLASRLQRTISAPIVNLVKTARSVSEHQDYSVRARVINQDELGVLTEQFNNMLATIQERDAVLEDQAEEMTRLKTTFLSNLSHEIRTPIAGIIGCADVLIEEADASLREFAEMIRQSGQRLLGTLNSVLALSRLEAREVKPHYELLDLNQEVHRIAQQFLPLARQKELTLDVKHGDKKAWMKLDRTCLEEILNHLIDNAVKFTEEGHILVEVVAEQDRVSIMVRDEGTGISPEFLPQIFDSFKQESSGYRRAQEGMGMGLTIAKKLVDLLGGTIEVESTQGVGSTFTVSFERSIDHAGGNGLVAPDRRVLAPSTTQRSASAQRFIDSKPR
ncbi:MAG: ATP-binding protein [Rhodothermales bacterium]